MDTTISLHPDDLGYDPRERDSLCRLPRGTGAVRYSYHQGTRDRDAVTRGRLEHITEVLTAAGYRVEIVDAP